MIKFLHTMSDFEKQLDRLKAEIAQKTAQYIAEQRKQKKEPTPMPRLETGMIGLSITHEEGLQDIGNWFIVIQVAEKHFRLVYESGGYDNLMEDYPEVGYDTNGIAEICANDYSEIVFLTKDVCFDAARRSYEGDDRDGCTVWRKYDKSKD